MKTMVNKNCLNKKVMVSLHYSFMKIYLNYKMQRTKLKKIVSKTQALQAIPITTPESESKSRQIMEKVSILNIYQFNF